MESLESLRRVPHLSVSAMKLWLSCPRKYRLRYVDKAEASHRSVALAFGHAWHSAIGHLLMEHQKGRSATLTTLADYFATALGQELASDGPPVLFDDDEDERTLIAMGARMLEAFLGAVPLPEKVLHVELPFRLELFDPATGEVLPVPLIGAIDAVVENSRRRELWEVKSAARRWSEDAVAFDFQPTAYRMAVRAAGDDGRWDRVHLKLLVATKTRQPEMQVEELVRLDQDERDLFETAASIVRAVEVGCAHPVRSWACRKCEYAEVCT